MGSGLTSHEQTQYNRVCYFHLFGVFLVSKVSKYLSYLSPLQLVFCPVAAVKDFSVHHHNADNIFWCFWILEFICIILKTEFYLCRAMEVASVAHFGTGHE